MSEGSEHTAQIKGLQGVFHLNRDNDLKMLRREIEKRMLQVGLSSATMSLIAVGAASNGRKKEKINK